MSKKNFGSKAILLLIYLSGFFLFLRGQYFWSGCAVVVSGFLSFVLNRPYSEIIVLSGLMILSLSFENRMVFYIVTISLIIMSSYDLIQFCKLRKDTNRDNWEKTLRENDLMHKLYKIINRKLEKN